MSKFEDLVKSRIKGWLMKDDIVMSSPADTLPESGNKDSLDANNNENIGKKMLVDDPMFDMTNRNNIYKMKPSRITVKTLKDLSLRDWLISTIIQTRIDTLARFTRVQNSKFEPGFKVIKRDGNTEVTDEEIKEIQALEDFILHCGRREKTPIEDQLSFSDFIKVSVRDALTYGHVAIEKVKTKGGGLHRFRPLPGESVRLIDKKATKEQIISNVKMARSTFKPGDNDPKKDWKINEQNIDYYKYVQVSYDERIYAAFGDEDMIFSLYNPQNFSDSLGYTYGMVELCIGSIINHMQIETYNCYLPMSAKVLKSNFESDWLENIKEGDFVYSDRGVARSVTATMSKDYDGDIYTIKPAGLMEQKITPEHPILMITGKNFINVKAKREFVFNRKWEMAKKLTTKDAVCIPKFKFNNVNNIIDLSKYGDIIDENFVTGHMPSSSKIKLPKLLEIDKDLAWVLGLYAGDGCVACRSKSGMALAIRIDLGLNEISTANRIKSIFDKYDITTTIDVKRCIQVYVYNSVFAKMFEDLIPGICENKTINPKVYEFSYDNKLSVLLGYIDSDGTINQGIASVTSVSYNLINGFSILLNSLGFLGKIKQYIYPSSFDKEKLATRYEIQIPKIFWTKNNINVVKNKQIKQGQYTFYTEDENYFYVKITKISKERYKGKIHNIEVGTDHSYLANQICSHNSKFFTNGYAARGILSLKGNMTQGDLTKFQRLFYNAINGSTNAWRTPIVAGLDDVKWIPLSGTAKEMEYINFNNHIMRIICSQFQIDPVELGLDYLITNSNRGVSSSTGNKEKINFSKERGLYPLIMFFEDLVNNKIIPEIDPILAAKYKFIFRGYTDDTPALEINRSQAEMSLYLSQNDLLRRAGKPTIKDPIADIPLNKAFLDLAERMYTRGELRSKFLGDKEAENDPNLQYIPGCPGFINWQKTLMQLQQQKDTKKQQKEQMDMQKEQMEQQAAAAEENPEEAVSKDETVSKAAEKLKR